jgi:hypothetical protein
MKHSSKAMVVMAAAAALLVAPSASADPFTFVITGSPGGGLQVGPPGGDALTDNEIDLGLATDDGDDDVDFDAIGAQPRVNRTVAQGPGQGAPANGSGRAKSNPELVNTFVGLNFHDQRFANGGNQFSVEPPDQGLCAGNGFVLESTNDVLRIFKAADGSAASAVVDLNTFYGYDPAINRKVSPLRFGPSVTDPSCYFDPDTQRWFHVVLTLDRASPTTQSLSGANHLDVAVSATSDPRGSWVVYRIPVQNDGTQGTPDHGCIARVAGKNVHGPCLGDYPHIGADANGFYVTTNEFNLAAPGFHGAQVYALSKHQLAANAPAVNVVHFDTTEAAFLLDGAPGFTIWPAQSPGGIYDVDDGGTEFFLSSHAVFTQTGSDNRLRVWTMTNTGSLDSASPAPVLSARVAQVTAYAIPPSSPQPAGNVPLRDCVADAACAPLVGATVFDNVEARLPSNDSRMQQVVYANGKLWGALDTGLVLSGSSTAVAGIAFFVLNPSSLHVFQQGYIGLENNNLTYPALAVTPSGRSAIAFTVVGPDHFPSAGYASLDAIVGAGDIHIVSDGAGPQDGFTGYKPLVNPIRPRWGDYGAAAADGETIWIASESIEQACTFTQYKVNVAGSRFGTCNETRGSLGNWATRISRLNLGP